MGREEWYAKYSDSGKVSTHPYYRQLPSQKGDPGFHRLLEELARMHEAKSTEYDNEERYQVIRTIAKNNGLKPIEVVWVQMDKHYETVRRAIWNDREPTLESIKSRLLDIANYALIACRLLEEPDAD